MKKLIALRERIRAKFLVWLHTQRAAFYEKCINKLFDDFEFGASEIDKATNGRLSHFEIQRDYHQSQACKWACK